jgi:hypothetical protein
MQAGRQSGRPADGHALGIKLNRREVRRDFRGDAKRMQAGRQSGRQADGACSEHIAE